MAVTSSGAISLSNINSELGVASTATVSFNDTAVRTLADPAALTAVGNPISISQFYGHRRNTGSTTRGSYANGVYFDNNNGGNGPKPQPGYIYGPTGVNTRMTNIYPCSTRYVADNEGSWGTGDRWGTNLIFIHPMSTLTEANLNAISLSLSDCTRAQNIYVTQWQQVTNDNDLLRYGVFTQGVHADLNAAAMTNIFQFYDPQFDAKWHYMTSPSVGYDTAYTGPILLPNPGVNQIVFLGIFENTATSWYRTISTSHIAYTA